MTMSSLIERFPIVATMALVLLILAGCGGSDPAPSAYSNTIADGRAAILQMLKDTGTPSASVALIDGENIVWSETFGYIDKTTNTPPALNTMFCIGSVSKVIAATATMILVDRGIVDLDTPVVKYLPDFRMVSPEYARITVRMLLNHSAGFGGADYRNMFTYALFPGYSAQVQQALGIQLLKHEPGYMSVYCNDCVTMIEPLVAKVSGMTYTEFVQKEILNPLGMKNSAFALGAFAPGSFAPGFSGATPDPQEYGQPYASGGLYTTPTDMAHLAIMLMNGGRYGGIRVLSGKSVAEMGRDQTLQLTFNPVPSFARGLGWDNVMHAGLAAVGVRAWHKKGGTMIYESDFVVAPDERLAVMVSFTARTMRAGEISERIMLHALAEGGRIPAVPQPLPNIPQPEKTATDADLNAITGTYANKNGPVRVVPDNPLALNRTLKVLTYNSDSGTWIETAAGLKLRIDGTFSSDALPNTSYRALTADSRRYLVKKEPRWSGHYLEETPHAQYIEPASSPSDAWKSRAGKNWLAVNEDAQSLLLVSGVPPRFRLDALDNYPGYLFATSIYLPAQIVNPAGSDVMARMFLKIPMETGRDLNDAVIETRNGEEWIRYGSTLYRPQSGVPSLPSGNSTVVIGSEGFAEWRTFSAAKSVTISGSSAWKLYDAALKLLASGADKGSVNASAGSYLILYGPPNSKISVTASVSADSGGKRS